MSLSNHNPDFSTQGDCSNKEYDPEWWFPEEKSGTRTWSRTYEANAAREVCKTCPLLVECRSYALQYIGIAGIWGGTDKYERREMQIKLRLTPTSWEKSYRIPMWE